MITTAQLTDFRTWFHQYVQHFYPLNSSNESFIKLKEEHTLRVCEICLEIGKSLGLSVEKLNCLTTIALFHDLGRFEQYTKYKTFADFKSENHALIAIRILRENNLLKDLNPTEKDMIYRVISNHNTANIPSSETGETLFFSKLIRDADKVDIYNILDGYYHNPDHSDQERSVVEFGMDKSENISDGVFATIMKGKQVKNEHLLTVGDHKALQFAWVFDLNFARSKEIIQNEGYLESIYDTTPKNERWQAVWEKIQSVF